MPLAHLPRFKGVSIAALSWALLIAGPFSVQAQTATPTDNQVAGYARSVGIGFQCVRAYLNSHDNQFPHTLKDLTDFMASAPANAQCS